MKTLALVMIVLLSSCAGLITQTSEEVAKYIDAYCLTGDPVLRTAMRDEINSYTHIGDIQITCEGDE